MKKLVNYRHPGNKWWRRLNMVGCDHIPFLLVLSAIAYRKFNLLLTGTVGTSKTTFCENLARALNKKYKTFDCDKLSHEYLQGDLNGEYMTRVPNAVNALTEAVVKGTNRMIDGNKTEPVTMPNISTSEKLYVNGVDDFPGGFLVFDEVKRADPKQQALVLNIGSHRVFDGKPVDSYIMYATNTQYAELYEFSEALLSRMNLVIQFPDIKDMTSEERTMMIESTGLEGDKVVPNDELIEKFALLEKDLASAEANWDPELLKEVKRFVHYLVAPLIQSVPQKVTARYVKNTIRIFYIYFKAIEIIEGIKFVDMDREAKRNAFFSVFPYTMFLEDLSDQQRSQIDNACYLAFANAFDKTRIRLLDTVKMMPEQSAIYLIWQKFIQEIDEKNFKPEQRDTVGIYSFLDRVQDYSKGNPVLQYMLYKRVCHDIAKHKVSIEKDRLNHFQETLDQHQAKITAFLKQDKSSIQIESNKLDPKFIENVILASTERVVSTLTRDPKLYETLFTILLALTPELASSDNQFIERSYDDLTQLMQL